METDIKQIVERLDLIQSDIAILKRRLVDVDTVLLDDDITALQEAEKDLKSGKTKRL